MNYSDNKPLVWLSGEIKTPPFSANARIQAGYLMRRLQRGEILSSPLSKPMISIGKRCYELRIQSENKWWRIIYRIDEDSIIIADVFQKKSNKTPINVIERCQKRLRDYDQII